MRIGAAYVRVSTDDQLEFSPDSQLRKIQEYAKAHDIVLSDKYIFQEEEGRSGRSATHRPEFQRMIGIAKLKPKPFDVILLWKFSRFARNREDSVVYKSMLRKQCGIDVLSVSENIGDDKMSILIEAFIEAMDEWYSINLSEEVIRGMTEKASRGGVVGSPAYGYLARDGQFIPHPEEAEIVRFVFDKFANEGMGCRDIALLLNAMGVRSKKGFPLENRTVEYMLHNPVYVGKIRWSPDGKASRDYNRSGVILADGQHEPIISLELFEQAQARFTQRQKMYGKHARQSQTKHDFMLRGIVRCSSCGSTLVRSRDGLQCHSYAKGACKESHYISESKANERILELIQDTLKNGNFRLSIRQSQKAIDDTKILETQIQREYAKLDRVRAAYEDGIDSLEEYKENKKKITATIENLRLQVPEMSIPSMEEARAAFIKKVTGCIADLQNPELDQSTKNLTLRSFIDQIVFNRYRNVFDIFYYV